MGVNKYDKPVASTFIPLPMQELFGAGAMMKANVDKGQEEYDKLNEEIYALKALPWRNEDKTSLIKKYEGMIAEGAGKMNQDPMGAIAGAKRIAMAFGRDRNTGFGHKLEQEYDIFQKESEQFDEMYKDDPIMLGAKEGFIQKPDFAYDPATGSYNQSSLKSPLGSFYKSYDPQELVKTLNAAVKNIDADYLGEYAKNLGTLDLNGITSLWKAGSIKGKDYQKIMQALIGQVPQEIFMSAAQAALAQGRDPAEELKIFVDKYDSNGDLVTDINGDPAQVLNVQGSDIARIVDGVSNASVSRDITEHYMRVDDKMKLAAIKASTTANKPEGGLATFMPGVELQLKGDQAMKDMAKTKNALKDKEQNLLKILNDPSSSLSEEQKKGYELLYIEAANARINADNVLDEQMVKAETVVLSDEERRTLNTIADLVPKDGVNLQNFEGIDPHFVSTSNILQDRGKEVEAYLATVFSGYLKHSKPAGADPTMMVRTSGPSWDWNGAFKDVFGVNNGQQLVDDYITILGKKEEWVDSQLKDGKNLESQSLQVVTGSKGTHLDVLKTTVDNMLNIPGGLAGMTDIATGLSLSESIPASDKKNGSVSMESQLTLTLGNSGEPTYQIAVKNSLGTIGLRTVSLSGQNSGSWLDISKDLYRLARENNGRPDYYSGAIQAEANYLYGSAIKRARVYDLAETTGTGNKQVSYHNINLPSFGNGDIQDHFAKKGYDLVLKKDRNGMQLVLAKAERNVAGKRIINTETGKPMYSMDNSATITEAAVTEEQIIRLFLIRNKEIHPVAKQAYDAVLEETGSEDDANKAYNVATATELLKYK